MSTPKVSRTYSSRNKQSFRPPVPSSPPSTLSSSPVAPAISRPSKRQLSENETVPFFSTAKRSKLDVKTLSKSKVSTKKSQPKAQKTLTQLHFNIDQTILRTCSLCSLSYTKGAPDDEALHKSHCTRVRQGLEWGKDEDKGGSITEIETGIKLKTGKKRGRIVAFPADATGKLGTKISTLLNTINLSLSAPELPPSVLQASRAYLFLVPHDTSHRERIAGCVIAQRITTAMAIVSSPSSETPSESQSVNPESESSDSTTRPIIVDSNTNLYCDPTPLPTPMGISRVFVSSSFRRQGIARHLLDAAAKTFIHGCPLDPLKGQAAFSQPTGMGQAVMMDWGKGAVRIYEE